MKQQSRLSTNHGRVGHHAATGEKRTHLVLTVAWSLFLALLFFLCVRAFVPQAPGVDSSHFLYVADGLLAGELPYIHRWDHKPPLIHLINAVGLLLSDVWGIQIVQVGFLVGTCLAACKLLKPRFGLVATLFAATVLLIYFARLLQGGNVTEQYALLLQFVALALFARAEARGEEGNKPSKRALMGLGALGGAAVMLRPDLAGVWFAIGLYWLAYRNNAGRKFGWAAVGGVAVLLGFVVWLALAGGLAALAAFWDAAVVYNVYYSDASLTRKFVAASNSFDHLFPVSYVVVLGWFIGIWQMLKGLPDDSGSGPLVRLAVVLLPIKVMLTGLSGYGFPHYFLALIPVACVLSAFAVDQLLNAFRARFPWAPMALFAIIAPVYVTSPHSNQASGGYDPAALRGLRHTVEQIKQLSEAGDPILIWGSTSMPYLAADRVAPTRHFCATCLLRGNKRKERIEQFTADVIANPPVLIVDLRDASLLPPLRTTDAIGGRWHPQNPRLIYDYRLFRPFFEFTDSDYALVKTVGRHDIFRKIR